MLQENGRRRSWRDRTVTCYLDAPPCEQCRACFEVLGQKACESLQSAGFDTLQNVSVEIEIQQKFSTRQHFDPTACKASLRRTIAEQLGTIGAGIVPFGGDIRVRIVLQDAAMAQKRRRSKRRKQVQNPLPSAAGSHGECRYLVEISREPPVYCRAVHDKYLRGSARALGALLVAGSPRHPWRRSSASRSRQIFWQRILSFTLRAERMSMLECLGMVAHLLWNCPRRGSATLTDDFFQRRQASSRNHATVR